ncbi:glycoside hydrolase family 5 protein [Urechidicola croceus]|uniref:glycoside hydrolase family 5 protein n=1 Tax=Urechidicola croceus TaxID=1850246 RepID=UPI0009F69C05|nr:cellulase family glycosylhydrolase [Urechidicola croceus]
MRQFLRTSGTKIIDSNNEIIRLKGVCFGNEVWDNDDVPEFHHSKIDFERVKNMGMNAIRFYLNYKTFESDTFPYKNKEEGWKWLDQNIEWARNNGIYLILNLHISHGGFQSLGDGDAIWNDISIQNRIISFWQKIANRYQNESQIAGYALLNEPVPINSIKEWQKLAENITIAIRKIDENHIIFLERAYYYKKNDKEDSNLNFPLINKENIVYEFHTYQPYQYTHQLIEWAGLGDGGKYPDSSLSHFINEREQYDNSNEQKYPRDKNYLRESIERYIRWGEQNNVPVYMGEFGTCISTFKDGKGGIKWVKDVLDIANDNQLSYTFHAYHEDTYALYYGIDSLPNPKFSNQKLINLFINSNK